MDYVGACIDEIALEGLDGITLSALWSRLEDRKPPFPLKLDEDCKSFLWSSVIAGHNELTFFEMEQPRPPLVIFNRMQHIDPDTGVIMEQKQMPEDIYPFCAVNDKQNGIIGSCSTYHSRRDVSDVVRNAPHSALRLVDVQQRWGERLVIVASQKLRNTALSGQCDCSSFTNKQFYLLERIGRSRYSGEATFGNSGVKAIASCPKSLFYLRKHLKLMQLIMVQAVTERQANGQHATSKVVTLTRFFVPYLPKCAVWMERLTKRLAELPEQRGLYSELRDEMVATLSLSAKALKQLLQFGRKHVKRDLIPYRTYYPRASSPEYRTKGERKERKVRILQLIKPYSCNSIVDDEDGNDEDGEDGDENVDEEGCDVDANNVDASVGKQQPTQSGSSRMKYPRVELLFEVPLLRQVYDRIEAAGPRGLSNVEANECFGLRALDTRSITRNLVRKHVIACVQHERGRQHVQRFIAVHHLNDSDRKVLSRVSGTPKINQKVAVADATAIAKDDTSYVASNVLDDTVDSIGQTSVLDSTAATDAASVLNDSFKTEESTPKSRSKIRNIKVLESSQRIRRKELILEIVHSAKVISHLTMIYKKISNLESSEYKADRKSIMRLIQQLNKEKQLKLITKKLPLPNGTEKELLFICDLSVTDSDPLFVREFDAFVEKLNVFKPKLEQKSLPETTAQTYGYLARMRRLRATHELLWFIIYGRQQEMVQNVQKCDASKQKPADAEAQTGQRLLPWQAAIPPPTENTGNLGEGWCFYGDVMPIIPVYIFCQIISVMQAIPGLLDYLSDNEMRCTLMRDMPAAIQYHLKKGRRSIMAFEELCIRLSELGLLSFGIAEFKRKELASIYLHRRGSLVETSLIGVPREEMPVHQFSFNTFADVQSFWERLENESLNTPLENFEIPEICVRLRKGIFKEDGCSRSKAVDEIVDIGRIPGDGRGACGFDSTLFLHNRRNWGFPQNADFRLETAVRDGTMKQHNYINRKKPKIKQPKQNDAPGVEAPAGQTDLTRGTPCLAENDGAVVCPKVESVKPSEASVKSIQPNRGGRGLKRKKKSKVSAKTKKLKSSEDVKATRKLGLNKLNEAKDMEAKSRMKKLRAAWTPEEDSLLLLCEVVIQFLAKLQQSSAIVFLRRYVIRDILHESIENSRDKTSLACQRRMIYMLKTPATVQNVDLYLCEALMDKELVKEFKTGKRYLKTQYDENTVLFRKCLKKFREKFGCFGIQRSSVNIPDTVEELNRMYVIHETRSRMKTQLTDVQGDNDVYFSVLQNLIHSALVVCDKISRAHELHQICNFYPEKVVNSAFASLKNTFIITKMKKTRNMKSEVNFGSSLGYYKLSQRYQYTWNSVYPVSIFEHTGTLVKDLAEKSQRDDDSNYLQLGDDGPSCVLAVTLMAQRKAVFKSIVPENIVVLKSISTAPLNFMDLEKEKKKATVDGEDDSDAEEEQLIEEAEKERAQEASSSDGSNTQSVLIPTGSSSRTILWLYQCQYVHSQSTKFLNANDNIVIHSCIVNIRLTDCDLPSTHCSNSARANDLDAHREICRWNRCHFLLHPQTCYKMLKMIRKLIPEKMKVITSDEPEEKHGDSSIMSDSSSVHLAVDIYNEIHRHGPLGITLYKLKTAFTAVSSAVLNNYLSALCNVNVVFRVGVATYRYVTHESLLRPYLPPWIIIIDKNIKGRGNRWTETQNLVDLRTLYIPAENMDTNEEDLSDAKQQYFSQIIIEGPLPVQKTNTVPPNNEVPQHNPETPLCSEQVMTDTASQQETSVPGTCESIPMDWSGCPQLLDSIALSATSADVPVSEALPSHDESTNIVGVDLTDPLATLQSVDSKSQIERAVTETCPLLSAPTSDVGVPVVAQTLQSPSLPCECNHLVTQVSGATSSAIRWSSGLSVSEPDLTSSSSSNAVVVVSSSCSESGISPHVPSLCTGAPMPMTIGHSDGLLLKTPPPVPRTLPPYVSTETVLQNPASADSQFPSAMQRTALETNLGLRVSVPDTDMMPEVGVSSQHNSLTSSIQRHGDVDVKEHSLTSSIQRHGDVDVKEHSLTSSIQRHGDVDVKEHSLTSSIQRHGDVDVKEYSLTSSIQRHGDVDVKELFSSHVLVTSPSTSLFVLTQSSVMRSPDMSKPLLSPTGSSRRMASTSLSTVQLQRSVGQSNVFVLAHSGEIVPSDSMLQDASAQPSTILIAKSPYPSVPSGQAACTGQVASSGSGASNVLVARSMHMSASTNPVPLQRPGTSSGVRPVSNSYLAAMSASTNPVPLQRPGTSSGVRPVSNSYLAAMTSARVAAPATTTPHVIHPSCPTGVPVRIRVDASQFGNITDPSALVAHVQELLAKNSAIRPGTQIRIRYMPPPAQPRPTPAATVERGGSRTETINGGNPSDRIPQVDGPVDSMDDDGDDDDERSGVDGEPIDAVDTVATLTANETPSCHLIDAEHSLESALLTAPDTSTVKPPPDSDSSLQSLARNVKTEGQKHNCRVSTYKTVRLIPRPWRTPEGTVNHVALKTMLSGVMCFVMEKPGVTRNLVIKKFENVLQPVPLFELLEMLEDIGCLYSKYFRSNEKPSLFSSRAVVAEVAEDTGCETQVFFPSVDCIPKLGQFIGQLQSGLWSSSH